MELLRNYWGIDVTILTTRASQALSESGICLFNGGDVHAFGLTHRCVVFKQIDDSRVHSRRSYAMNTTRVAISALHQH